MQFFHLDVPTRDMRLMDATHGAAGSNPAANNQLLVRDNALLICMEHVRCIITADLVRTSHKHNQGVVMTHHVPLGHGRQEGV